MSNVASAVMLLSFGIAGISAGEAIEDGAKIENYVSAFGVWLFFTGLLVAGYAIVAALVARDKPIPAATSQEYGHDPAEQPTRIQDETVGDKLGGL